MADMRILGRVPGDETVHAWTLTNVWHLSPDGWSGHADEAVSDCVRKAAAIIRVPDDEPVTCEPCLERGGKYAVRDAERIVADALRRVPA